MHTLKRDFDSPGCSVAQLGPLAIVVWRGEMQPEPASRQHALIEREFKAGRTVGLMVVIEEGVPPPSDEVRKILAVSMERFAPLYVGQALVVSGEGFRAAAVRGWITTMSVLSRSKIPARAFATDAEAIAWLRPKFGLAAAHELSLMSMLDAIAAVRTI